MVVVEAPLLCRRDEKGEGGEFFVVELGKVESFFNFTHGDGSSRQPNGGRQANDMGNSHWLPCARSLL